jgi:hypothetical protein
VQRAVDPAESVELALDRELAMVAAAVGLVSTGRSPRVVLAGLRFAEQLMPEVSRLAGAAGVRAVPLWMPRSEGVDIAIEQTEEGVR